MRRILLSAEDQLLLSIWSGRRLQTQHRLPADATGFAALAGLLRQHRSIATDLLIDSARERHRLEPVPRLARGDRRAMTQTLIARHLGDCDLTTGGYLGEKLAEPAAIRLSGLSLDDRLRRLFAVLVESGVGLARILSIPLLAETTGFGVTDKGDGRLLISRQCASSRRFSYYVADKLVFSRVLPGAIDDVESVTNATTETLRFVRSRETTDNARATTIVLLEAATATNGLSHAFQAQGLPAPVRLDPEALLQSAIPSIEPETNSGRADRLFCALAAQRPGLAAHYTDAGLLTASGHQHGRLSLASGVIAVAISAMSATYAVSSTDLQTLNLRTRAALDALADLRLRKLPGDDVSRGDLARQLDHQLATARTLAANGDRRLLQLPYRLAQHLSLRPEIIITSLSWASAAAPSSGAANPPTQLPSSGMMVTATLEGRIGGDSPSLYLRGRHFKDLLHALKADPSFTGIEVVEGPLQQLLNFTGTDANTNRTGIEADTPSRFSLRLTLGAADAFAD